MKGGIKNMFSFKKIASALASVAMVGATVGFATAAYPQPFVSTAGVGDVGVVYGSSDDLTAATNIGTNLAGSLATSVGAPTGESLLFEKASTKLRIGWGITDVIATNIDDDSPNGGLPTLLADGVYIDDDNDEFDYTQKISVSNQTLTMWENDEYIDDEPTVGFQISNGAKILNYTLDWVEEPLWDDLATTDVTIMGKDYFVLSVTENTTLNLLDAANSATLAQGESTTMTIDGVTYTVSLDFVGSSTAKFTINGDTTNALAAGETQKVAGAYIGIKSVDSQEYATGIKNVEFSLGTGKLKLVSGSDIEMNDVAVDDVKVWFYNTGQASGGTKINKMDIEWDADDDLFITETTEVTMPGFEAVKFSFTGMVYPVEEEITIKAGSENYIKLENFPLKTSDEDINLVTIENTTTYNNTLIGKDQNNQLRTTNESSMYFNESRHDYFVASYNDGSNAESYLMRATTFAAQSTGSATNVTTFEYKKDGVWTNAGSAVTDGEEVTIGNVVITVDLVDKESAWVNFTGGTNVEFNTLYSKEGLKMWLPWSNVTAADGATGPTGLGGTTSVIPGFLGITRELNTHNLTFQEEDNNENIDNGNGFNITLGFNSASTPEVSVEGVSLSEPGNNPSFVEIQDTDVFRSFNHGAIGTEFLWDKPSSGQKSIKIIYHGGESYGQLYLTAPDSGTSSSSGTIVPVMDTEVAGVSANNLIVVGGSCVNSVAAKLLGSEVPLCEGDWSSMTGRSADQWIIKTFASPYAADKIAVLVAGYEKADTAAAANYFTTTQPDMATVGAKVDGPVA